MNFRFWRKKVVKTIRAREFVLEDAKGRERAALKTDGVDNALLYFRGPDGAVRCFIGVTPDGTPRIALQYAGGKGTIELEANDRLNTAALVLSGPNGKSKAVLAVAANGVPAIVLYDENGQAAWAENAALPAQHDPGLDTTFTDWDSFLRG
ncbi:MAG: hypothetical protein HZB26_16195 [Candidatus Hydrogenedentes bacterium]|nr:hypothetical protein [Candidatus Hydrogenedentota bacterium]